MTRDDVERSVYGAAFVARYEQGKAIARESEDALARATEYAAALSRAAGAAYVEHIWKEHPIDDQRPTTAQADASDDRRA